MSSGTRGEGAGCVFRRDVIPRQRIDRRNRACGLRLEHGERAVGVGAAMTIDHARRKPGAIEHDLTLERSLVERRPRPWRHRSVLRGAWRAFGWRVTAAVPAPVLLRGPGPTRAVSQLIHQRTIQSAPVAAQSAFIDAGGRIDLEDAKRPRRILLAHQRHGHIVTRGRSSRCVPRVDRGVRAHGTQR